LSGGVCQGICKKLKNVRSTGVIGGRNKGGRNRIGEKRCIVCEIKIKTDELRCPCCKHVLRVRTIH